MNNEFGVKLKNLREKHFPGHSMRKVADLVAPQIQSGDYFFTQLNKMESGVLIPSANLLLKILDAYSADAEERKEVLIAYATAAALKKVDEVGQASKQNIHREVVESLHRKLKEKN